ncbi:5,6-dimethylbenzimidazole synthase [Vibrio coralliilyticus]|uniref:5,6-dimethylbenzimidazole synthase n=1 Tax=Vibrio coralliilyticus TaxID=190893 RepID=A0AAN0VY40_9VIBR|nr:5,6-dimethylbenzimidazole synthase [Vibrio coralliilyticus]AIW19101.1 cob(II)yrinic acid a,c-diamide reductase [Vibrio coralliilyticus]NOH40823.1 5,6-dimethylbenzimidazole synthase [Vibrio coralliilyticus]
MFINEEERDALYKVIFSRRDVRRDFIPKVIPEDVLLRILTAGHHAPSVGFMQPWDFILVTEKETKKAIKQGYEQARVESAEQFSEEKREQYRSFKLEGILEAPLGICVTCDRERNGPVVIGRTIKPEMDLYSTVCAIQNMWLAARAENIGLGWVSIIHDEVLRSVLGIPEDKDIIGYLCLGYVSKFNDKPELEEFGWLKREELNQLIHREKWSQ